MNQLKTLYEAKLDLYKQLVVLSRQFGSVTISSEANSQTGLTWVQSLLEQRSELMLKIDEIDKLILKCEGTDGFREDHDTLEIKTNLLAIAREIARCNERLTSILEREIGIIREATHKEQTGNQSNRAYLRTPEQGEGFFIDKKR